MKGDVNTLDIPMKINEETGKNEPAMTQLEYAQLSASNAVASVFSPEQLVGTQFEGVHQRLAAAGYPASGPAAAGAAAPPAGGGAAPGGYDARQTAMIEAASRKLKDGTTTPEKVAEVFSQNGITIDPATLK